MGFRALRAFLLTIPVRATLLPLETTTSLFDPPSKKNPTSLDREAKIIFPVTDK